MKNNETERARLTRIYSEMSDVGLRELAGDAKSLTGVAKEVLNAELLRRSIEPVLATETGEKPEEDLELADDQRSPKYSGPLVMVKRFRDLPEAFVAKSILDSAQMDSFLADENIVRIDWLYSNLVGGAKLMVRPEDLEAARALLDESANEASGARDSEQTNGSSTQGESGE